ncbi:MAG: ABC-F family ATP-binding cassette domain-containing protein [Helicobacteraceae bacterium]|jgi:ATP-binding cassette subfamily F protein uup|nr:ABC-F family ATP-binding cassette domain-containing protein [Helicobacteraceae bacterium]
MALVDLKAISKQYEAQKILDAVNFAIDERERVAIVGRNGSGKSTLLRIVAGILEADDGERMTQNNLTIETLDQNPILDETISVKKAIENSLTYIMQLKEEYVKLTQKISEGFDDKTNIDRLAQLGSRLDFFNAWDINDRIERVLTQFNLKALENSRIGALSGGEKRRVALGALLLKNPDLLLLDEPTNHLDVYMVRFLEELILESKSAFLIISHDRYFIDRIATRTIEIENGRLRSFNGGYNLYLEQKAIMLESMMKSHETLVKRLRYEQEWLNRGVKARLKRNMGRVERIKQMKEDAKKNPSAIRKVRLELEREQKAFNWEESVNRRKALFEIENLSIGIENKPLIKTLTARILQQDKIAIVGKNGSGKTTLLLTLLGRQDSLNGKIKIGCESIGYFDQNRSSLDDNKNLLETFCPNGGDRINVRGSNIHVYGYMKNWLFPKEFLDKKIGSLSGGEKNRVALALLFSKKYDCLILDEPTNDLDIPTINILEEYLQSYQGALLFVSHDRYFIDKIAAKLWIIKDDQSISEELCNYSDYLEDEALFEEIDKLELASDKEASKTERKRSQSKFSYKEQKLYEILPIEIDELEKEIKRIENDMIDDRYSQIELVELNQKLEGLKTCLETKIETYFELEERKENYVF